MHNLYQKAVNWLGYLGFVAVFVGSSLTAEAGKLGFLEQYALPSTRTQALKQLLPGTRDYYYYHALHKQGLGQLDQVDALVQTWKKKFRYDSRRKEILRRQALLRYNKSPQTTLAFLKKAFYLRFHHQRSVQGKRKKRVFPSRLDPKVYSHKKLLAKALRSYYGVSYVSDRVREWLVANQALNMTQTRKLLRMLKRPDVPGLLTVILGELSDKDSRGFGSLSIHKKLTVKQLRALMGTIPNLRNKSSFINLLLRKMAPAKTSNWDDHPTRKRAYLNKLWAFVSTLKPAHNSLKLHVLYHILKLDRSQGIYNHARFLRYIKIPRYAPYVNRDFVKLHRYHTANRYQYYSSTTGLPRVGNDEPLVQSFLAHFFLRGKGIKAYDTWLKDTYLKPLLAKTKLLAGQGKADKWYGMLSASSYKALKERVDIDFAHTNKQQFGGNEKVALDLHIKNVKTLLVKVYRINTYNYYSAKKRRVNVRLKLDGLIANKTFRYTYNERPLRRVKRRFSFASLQNPGVYIVDFIGNGKSSRVLIRKGILRLLSRTSVAGHVLRIIDGKGRHLPGATMFMGGKEYKPNKQGLIRIPFSNRPGTKRVILHYDGLFRLATFAHKGEQYRFRAGIYIDRESVLTRNKAKIVVRPTLSISGALASLKIVKKASLIIRAYDRFGVKSTKTVDSFKLHDKRDSTYVFRVPENLRSLYVQLKVTIQNLSKAKEQSFTSSASFQYNRLEQTSSLAAFHLRRIKGKYVLSYLDRTGIGIANQRVSVRLKHRDFSRQVYATLQTNAKGRVLLGSLKNISTLRVTAYGKSGYRFWKLSHANRTYPTRIHTSVGQAIDVPFTGNCKPLSRADVSLLQLRNGRYVSDFFGSLQCKPGFLVLRDLPAGHYRLTLKQVGRTISIRLLAGIKQGQYIVSQHQALERTRTKSLQVTGVQTTANQIVISVANAGSHARFHVIATRYVPDFDPYSHLNRAFRASKSLQTFAAQYSAYQVGRRLSDEYRYILERRNQQAYPGMMLKRPGLLLHPWAVRKTQTGRQRGRQGQEGRAFGKYGRRSAYNFDKESIAGDLRKPSSSEMTASLDFLPTGSVLLANLKANKQGQIIIDRSKLGAHQHIHVIAIDPFTTVYRQLSLEDSPVQHKDLRLLAALAHNKHYAQKRQVSVLTTGKPYTIQDVTSAKFDTYDSLSKVYRLLTTLKGGSKLASFAFVLKWPALSMKEKLANYSKYACHELNFFLSRKDKAFFAKVVAPTLANKKDKTFLDHYLLGHNLVGYLRPWAFAQLNVAERILLGKRLQTQAPHIARYIKEQNALRRPSVRLLNRLFETAIQTSSLDTNQGRLDKLRGLIKLDSIMIKGKDGDAPRRARSRNGITYKPKPSGSFLLKKKEAPKPPAQKTAPSADDDMDNGYHDKKADLKARNEAFKQQFYRQLEKTKEWAENNYYKLTIHQQNARLIQVNGFWNDFAAHSGKTGFTSRHITQAARNFTEMMFVLSLLDLPFTSGKHKRTFKRLAMTIHPKSTILLFHKQILPAAAPAHKSPILLGQHYFRRGARYKYVKGQRRDRYVRGEFLYQTVYGTQVVVTNPSSSTYKLNLLLQIPQGAMPVSNGRRTRSIHMSLSPYQTRRFTYYFYFPRTGTFTHFPAHASQQGKLLAWTTSSPLKVVENPTVVDKTTWAYISQNGTEAEVFKYIANHNIFRINLRRIAWRVNQSKAFYKQLKQVLKKRFRYDKVLASYSIKYNDTDGIREYLQHRGSFVRRSGKYLKSPLLTIDPVVRKTYEHLEYRPLVNARAHQLGKQRKIVNGRFYQQYQKLLGVLKYKAQLDQDDLMAVTYYLLLQDRVHEAMQAFAKVKRSKLATKMQYDYFAAYMAFYKADLKTARTVASKYKSYSIVRWRKLFLQVLSQLDEIEGKKSKVVDPKDRTERQTRLASAEASFQFKVDAKQIRVSYQNVKALRVNYYKMDIELLFSRNPFLKQPGGQFTYIQPNATQLVALKGSKGKTTFALPKALQSSNVMIEMLADGERQTSAYYANALDVQVMENYGQIKVTHETSGKALAKVYVKVYARRKNGQVRFYKDGYTDLRGRFDYSSLSTNDLDHTKRFSILILSKQHGAVVREATPPKQ